MQSRGSLRAGADLTPQKEGEICCVAKVQYKTSNDNPSRITKTHLQYNFGPIKISRQNSHQLQHCKDFTFCASAILQFTGLCTQVSQPLLSTHKHTNIFGK